MDADGLAQFWETIPKKFYKHFRDFADAAFINDHVGKFHKHALDQVPLDEIGTAIEWGCGGGLLACEVPSHIDLQLVDISRESLAEAAKHCQGDGNVRYIHWPHEQPEPAELIWCYAVIQHFPSVQYWYDIASTWVNLDPKWLCLSPKIGNVTTEATDYATDFISALILDRDTFRAPFWKKYEEVYYEPPHETKLAYSVWRRK